MKQTLLWSGWIILLFVVCFQSSQQSSQAQKSDSWTYTSININTASPSIKDLDNLGQQGWEVVVVQGFSEHNSQSVVLLKRKL